MEVDLVARRGIDPREGGLAATVAGRRYARAGQAGSVEARELMYAGR
jgi:hypothetical protein